MVPELVLTDMPEIEPEETVPLLSPMPMWESEPEPALLSSGARMEPSLVPMEMSLIVPWPAAAMVPALVDTDMPEIEPEDTVPLLSPMPMWDSEPEPALLSSGARMEPSLVPMEMSVIVPWPAATMVPEFVLTDMPEIEPLERVPLLSPTTTCDSEPEPALLSSGARMEPSLVPMEMSVIVPWPAATMVPEFVLTDMPEIEPEDTVPLLSPTTTCDSEPEPALLSSGARMDPS